MKKLIATIMSLGFVIGANAADYNAQPVNTSMFSATQTQSGVSDQNISDDIHDELDSGWFTKGFESVTFKVNNGVVSLTGTVPTTDDKINLEKAIRNIDGVRSLDSQLAIQDVKQGDLAKLNKFPQDTFKSPADQQLNMKIRDNVSDGFLWTSYKNVKLNTSNGTVTLEGTVDSIKDQQKLMDKIRGIDGVNAVVSNLTITNK